MADKAEQGSAIKFALSEAEARMLIGQLAQELANYVSMRPNDWTPADIQQRASRISLLAQATPGEKMYMLPTTLDDQWVSFEPTSSRDCSNS